MLLAWLKSDNLYLSRDERNTYARINNNSIHRILKLMGEGKQEIAKAKRLLKSQKDIFAVNPEDRKFIRSFAVYCMRSSGFRVV